MVNTEFGIAATFDGTHFIADPKGMVELEKIDRGNRVLDLAHAACADVGGRLVSVSGLRALYDINAVRPADFAVNYYYSYSLNSLGSGAPFHLYFGDGVLHTGGGATTARIVRCGI